MNKIFDRFKRRLMTEAIGKSALNSALIGGSIELIFLIVMHLISVDPGWMWIAVAFALPFFLSFALFFGIAYYPTQKRVARRIDEWHYASIQGPKLARDRPAKSRRNRAYQKYGSSKDPLQICAASDRRLRDRFVALRRMYVRSLHNNEHFRRGNSRDR